MHSVNIDLLYRSLGHNVILMFKNGSLEFQKPKLTNLCFKQAYDFVLSSLCISPELRVDHELDTPMLVLRSVETTIPKIA